MDHYLALQRLLDIHQGRQGFVDHLHRLRAVLGQVTALGQHHRHRVADVVHLAVGQRVLQKSHQVAVRPKSYRDVPWLHRGRDVLEREHRSNPRHLKCGSGVDRHDTRVGVGAAHDGSVERVGQLHVIHELPPAGQKPPVLFAPHGCADVACSHVVTFGPVAG